MRPQPINGWGLTHVQARNQRQPTTKQAPAAGRQRSSGNTSAGGQDRPSPVQRHQYPVGRSPRTATPISAHQSGYRCALAVHGDGPTRSVHSSARHPGPAPEPATTFRRPAGENVGDHLRNERNHRCLVPTAPARRIRLTTAEPGEAAVAETTGPPADRAAARPGAAPMVPRTPSVEAVAVLPAAVAPATTLAPVAGRPSRVPAMTTAVVVALPVAVPTVAPATIPVARVAGRPVAVLTASVPATTRAAATVPLGAGLTASVPATIPEAVVAATTAALIRAASAVAVPAAGRTVSGPATIRGVVTVPLAAVAAIARPADERVDAPAVAEAATEPGASAAAVAPVAAAAIAARAAAGPVARPRVRTGPARRLGRAAPLASPIPSSTRT